MDHIRFNSAQIRYGRPYPVPFKSNVPVALTSRPDPDLFHPGTVVLRLVQDLLSTMAKVVLELRQRH